MCVCVCSIYALTNFKIFEMDDIKKKQIERDLIRERTRKSNKFSILKFVGYFDR